MGKPNYFVAIDIGTSFIKGALLDLDRRQLLHIQRQPFPDPVANLAANFFEVDPDTLVVTIRSLLDSLLGLAPDCLGIVTCTQMHSLVLTDTHYHPLSNLITWRDQRAVLPHPSGEGTYFDQLLSRLTDEDLAALGGGLRAGLPVGTLFWMAQNQLLPTQEAIPLTLSEFVMTQLCGTDSSSQVESSSWPNNQQTIKPLIEPTNAAAYGAYNVEQGDWHYDVLTKLGLAHLKWPEVGSIHSITGYVHRNGRPIPCYSSVGDHQCALAGAFLQQRELSLNIATGAQASLITPHLKLGNYETRPYFDQRFINTIVKIPAGRSLTLLVDLITELASPGNPEQRDPWALIATAVEAVPQTDLQINLAFYDSQDGATGSITNIREDNLNVGHLFRAAVQNMAENFYECAVRISDAPTDWEQIVFSGGLVTKFDALRAAILHQFQSAHRLCLQEEDTLLGMLVLALTINGQAETVAEATRLLANSEQNS
ncbi:MAG: FGGY family carbohydrate kinase [Chloroflexota bacterium]